MSSAIKQALNALDQVIDRLESTVEVHENNLRGQQPDLFSSSIKPASNDLNPDLLAGKLDKAIAQVEKILAENA